MDSFDDLDLGTGFDDNEDSGFSDFDNLGDFGDSFGNDLGAGFGSENEEATPQTLENANKGEGIDKKQSLIIIGIGVVVIVLALIIGRILLAPKESTKPIESQPGNVTTEVEKPSNLGGWQEFNGENSIEFSETLVNSIFTVTGIKHYVQSVDIHGNIAVKSILTGTLSGYVGTYELEIPYSKGSRLVLGSSFDVKVEVGEFDGRIVVGEIRY